MPESTLSVGVSNIFEWKKNSVFFIFLGYQYFVKLKTFLPTNRNVAHITRPVFTTQAKFADYSKNPDYAAA